MTKKKKKEKGEESEGLDEESSVFDWEGIKPEDASRILKGIESMIPEIVKKTVVQGVGNVLFNEDGIRSTFEGKKELPKEAVGFLFNQGDAMRKEILRMISNEVRTFLENMDFGGEIAKILTTLSFEIKTEVRFIPNDERVRPSIKNTVKVKRQKGKKEKGKDEGEEKKAFSRWRRKAKADHEEE